MDAPASPLGLPKRQSSTKTYGRAFKKRASHVGGAGASSSPAPMARGGRVDASDSDDDDDDDNGRALPVKATRSRAGGQAEGGRAKRAVVQLPTRASPRRASSLARPAAAPAAASKDASAGASTGKAGPSTSRRSIATTRPPAPPPPKPIVAGTPALSARRASSSLASVPKVAAEPPTAPVVAKGNGRLGSGISSDKKGKSRASSTGMGIVLPEPRSSSPASSRAGTPVGRTAGRSTLVPVPRLGDAQKRALEPAALDGGNSEASAARTTLSTQRTRPTPAEPFAPVQPLKAAFSAPVPPVIVSRSVAKARPTPVVVPHSPKRIRLASPPAHLKAQTPPGDILQQADYFAFPSPARNLFGSAPSSPLTPLSSSVAQSSPLRHPLAPSSPSRSSATRQHLHPRAKPTPLAPSSPSAQRTPTKSASTLSALFDEHLADSSGSLSSVGRSGGSRAAQSPEGASASSLALGSGGVDEEGGSLGKLINLPARKRRVDQMLQRSNTAPSLGLGGNGGGSGSRSGARTPVGKSASALFPSPRLADEASTSAAALWDVPVHLSPSVAHPGSPADEPSPVRPKLQPAKRRTYGGSSRSMVVAQVRPGVDSEADDGERESYAKMAKRWGVDQRGAGLEEGDAVDDTIELPTITSLRARGDNQHFLDDLGYLLDGLQSDELGVRRSSSVDLLRKMASVDFRRSLKTHDQVDGVWELLTIARGKTADMVLDASLILFLALLAKDGRSLEPILARKGARCSAFIREAMATPRAADGFALERKARAGKGKGKGKDRSALRLMEDLSKLYLETNVGRLTPSLRSAASSVLKHVVLESGAAAVVPLRVDPLRADDLTETVARSLRDELAGLPARLKAYESGLVLLSSSDSPDFQHVQQCLVVLEVLLTRFPESTPLVQGAFGDLPALLGTLLTVARAELRNPSKVSSPTTVLLCLISALRTLLGLSTASEPWATAVLLAPSLLTTLARLVDSSRRSIDAHDGAELADCAMPGTGASSPLSAAPPSTTRPSSAFATSDGPGHDDDGDDDDDDARQRTLAAQLEILCLSLGLLSKLVETVPACKEVARGTLWRPECGEEGACAVVCRCAGARSMLLCIVDLYEDQRTGSSAEASYLSGYAVLLLGHLMRGSSANAAVILPALSAPPSAADSTAPDAAKLKLEALALELQAFSDVHTRFRDKLSSLTQATTSPARAATESHVAAGPEELGLDAESLQEIRSGVRGLPSKEAGVGAVREMIGVLRAMAAAAPARGVV